MKLLRILSGLAIGLVGYSAYGSELNNYSGEFHLDQSKNIYFDEYSSNSYSLQLLKDKTKFANQDVILGGSAELDFQHWQGDQVFLTPPPPLFYQVGTQVYFTQAQFDAMSNLNNNWLTSFISLTDGHIGQNGSNGNNVYLSHAFLLFGNLDKTPIYITLGISDISFGVFNGIGGWDSPLTSSYFEPAQSPQASIGFYKNNFNASATTYEDQTNFAHHNVYSLYYNNTIKSLSYGFGVGYLTHLASNSTGIAFNSQKKQQGLIAFNLGNIWDYSVNMGYGPFAFTAEYINGSNEVGVNNGLPKSLAETISYTRAIYGKDTTFGIGYSNSIHLNNIPTGLEGQDTELSATAGIKNRWVFAITRPIISDAFQLSLSTEKDRLYSADTTYTYTLDLMAYL